LTRSWTCGRRTTDARTPRDAIEAAASSDALRLGCEFQIPVYVRHRIQAIDHKIHEDLLQLHANLP